MKHPNKKEQLLLKIYKSKLEERNFDEQDIISFLIYIRSLFEKADKSNYLNIYDICDFVAHRRRDDGKTHRGILASIANDYQTKKNSNEIAEYDGIRPEQWKKEWNKLGKELSISISDAVLNEISICILSMLQFTSFYQDMKANPQASPVASMQILQGKDFLCLCSTEGAGDSRFIVYFKIKGLSFLKHYNVIIDDAVYAKREGGKLRLISEYDDYII